MSRPTEIVNAQIKRTMLGFEDHGIFTAFLFVEWPGSGCGFGGYHLGKDVPDESKGYGAAFIQRILRTVGVEKWEELQGKYIRVESEGLGGGIRRIGHIIEDKWFDPKALADEFRGKNDPAN